MKLLRLLALSSLPLFALSLSACSPPVTKCDSNSCAGGCCDATGQCRAGSETAACGTGGNLCTQCFTGQTCSLGLCQSGQGGGGGGQGGGGGGMGGGGGGGGQLMCAPGKTACSGTCVDLLTSERNCGNCGTLCNSNQFCNRGMCAQLPQDCTQAACPTGYYCAGTSCQPGCASNTDCPQPGMCDPMTHICSCVAGYHQCGEGCDADNNISSCGPSCANCGGIANAVPACTNNACDFTCNAGYHRCGNECKDNNQIQNCGSSCSPCTPPANSMAICTGQACDFICNTGFHKCGNGCVDNNSVNSCGGTSCTPCTPPANATATCNGVACDFTCNSGFHRCGSTCVANNSISGCGTSCSPCQPPAGSTATCDGVSCGFSCNTATHACGGQCVSNNSVNSCGTTSCSPCVPPAGATSTCNGVSCDFVCNSGTHRCGAACSDNFSVNSCGSSSCTACPNGPANSTRTCNGVSCGWQCAAGFHDCGGACVSDTSTTQCGLSCVSCTPPANASPICSGGACDFVCNSGFHRCGSTCRADSDVDACGSACSVCPNGPANSSRACLSGMCVFACDTGYNACNAQCVASDTLTSCGVSCTQCGASGTFDRPTCTGGVCGTACITSCNSTCVDVNTDESNCGGCGTTCTGGQTCSEGTCRATCATGVAFSNVVPYTTLVNVGSPYRFVMEDLNNDGRVDLLDNGNTGMQASLSAADGTFSLTRTWTMTTRPIAIAAVDLDGDGFKDVVGLRNSTSTQVFVVRNVAGTLSTTGTSYSVSGTASAFTFFDANGDGRLDIVVGTSTNGAILPQSAVTPGTFNTATTFTQPFASPLIMESGQIDADGRADLVYASTTQYRVARQTSVGVFTLGTAVSQAIVSLQVKDLNGNGTQDLLIRSGANALVIAQGNGDGTFVSSSVTFTGSAGVIAADLNNDANLDLITGSTSVVYVGLATAPGTWPAAPPNYLVNSPGGGQNLLAVGQVIGDARPEIFSAGVVGTTNTLSTLINDGSGQFPGARASGLSGGPFASLAAGDFDGDGDRDLVALPAIATGGSGNASVLLGSSDGSFGASVATLALRGDEYAVGRINMDAMEDLAVIIESAVGPGVEVRIATGGGTFAAPVTVSTTAAPVKVVLGNVNGDSFNDLVIATTSGVEWAPGNGDGTFQAVRNIVTLASVNAIALVDLNMDGRPELVANASTTVRVYGNLGMGTFTTVAIGSATTASGVTEIAWGDLDQDGRPDLAINSSAGVQTYRNGGNGTLTAQAVVSVSGRIRLVDLDNDGLLDLIATTTASDFATFKGLGPFSFSARSSWAPGRQLSQGALVVDRINTDTFRDIVVLNPTGEIWSYLGVCR